MFRTPSEMTIGERIVLTIVIVLVILFALAFFGFVAGRWSEEAQGQAITDPPQLYQGIPLDAHLLGLDKRALEEAYHHQAILLFATCLKDGCKDATYFQNGLRNARRFYLQAAQQIARREGELIEKGMIEEDRK